MSYMCRLNKGECDCCGACTDDTTRICPACGEELHLDDKVYTNFSGEIVGCEYCCTETTLNDYLA